MKDRILEFLRAENKSSAQFAEEIGVQASGISHIISGRNNPSLDFILKMLEKYKYLSTEWLLFGKGSMYKDNRLLGLFEDQKIITRNSVPENPDGKQLNQVLEFNNAIENDIHLPDKQVSDNIPSVVRIVWFFTDNSFREYFPEKG